MLRKYLLPFVKGIDIYKDVLAYADDLVIFIKTPEDCEKMIGQLQNNAPRYGIHLSLSKSTMLKLSNFKMGDWWAAKRGVFPLKVLPKGTPVYYLGAFAGTNLSRVKNRSFESCQRSIKFFKYQMRPHANRLRKLLNNFYCTSVLTYRIAHLILSADVYRYDHSENIIRRSNQMIKNFMQVPQYMKSEIAECLFTVMPLRLCAYSLMSNVLKAHVATPNTFHDGVDSSQYEMDLQVFKDVANNNFDEPFIHVPGYNKTKLAKLTHVQRFFSGTQLKFLFLPDPRVMWNLLRKEGSKDDVSHRLSLAFENYHLHDDKGIYDKLKSDVCTSRPFGWLDETRRRGRLQDEEELIRGAAYSFIYMGENYNYLLEDAFSIYHEGGEFEEYPELYDYYSAMVRILREFTMHCLYGLWSILYDLEFPTRLEAYIGSSDVSHLRESWEFTPKTRMGHLHMITNYSKLNYWKQSKNNKGVDSLYPLDFWESRISNFKNSDLLRCRWVLGGGQYWNFLKIVADVFKLGNPSMFDFDKKPPSPWNLLSRGVTRSSNLAYLK